MAMSILVIPILPQIRTVLPQESAGPVPHGICHRDGDKVAVNCPGFLLPRPQKGCGSGMWLWSLCTTTSPREMEQAAGDLAACIPPRTWERVMGWEGRTGGCGGPGAPVPTHGEQLVGAHALQLCAQLAPRSPWARAGHGPRRMGGRNGYWSAAQGSLCWN